MIKLNLIVFAALIIPFLFLLWFYKISIKNIPNVISIDNTVNYLGAALAILLSTNIQYFFYRKRGRLVFIGEEKPKYDGGSILFENNRLYAINHDIEFISLSVSCENSRIVDIVPDINNAPNSIINSSNYSEVFKICFRAETGNTLGKIEMIWQYKIAGEEKVQKGKKIIKHK